MAQRVGHQARSSTNNRGVNWDNPGKRKICTVTVTCFSSTKKSTIVENVPEVYECRRDVPNSCRRKTRHQKKLIVLNRKKVRENLLDKNKLSVFWQTNSTLTAKARNNRNAFWYYIFITSAQRSFYRYRPSFRLRKLYIMYYHYLCTSTEYWSWSSQHLLKAGYDTWRTTGTCTVVSPIHSHMSFARVGKTRFLRFGFIRFWLKT